MQRFASTTYGLRAFQILRTRYRKRDKENFAVWCSQQFKQLKSSPLADNFLYEAGRVFFERKTVVGDKKAAHLFQRIRTQWKFETSPLWDDATWDLSLVRHRQGQYVDEIALLHDLLSTREPTWLLGSYDIKNYKHAAFRIGMVYYEDLKQYAEAAKQFNAFPKLFKHSTYRDDAMWWEGNAWLRAEQPHKAQRAFQRLLKEYPNSQLAKQIQEQKQAP